MTQSSVGAVHIGILLVISLTLVFADSAVAQVRVPFERIRGAADEPGNWLTYGGNYNGHRHSGLEQLTPKNVAALKPAWVYQSKESGRWEVTPLVVDGIIYVSERPNIVTAIDGRTGRPLWNYRRPMPDEEGVVGEVEAGGRRRFRRGREPPEDVLLRVDEEQPVVAAVGDQQLADERWLLGR